MSVFKFSKKLRKPCILLAPGYENNMIRITFLSFTTPTLTNFLLWLGGLGSLVMLQNQLHPPFFSLYCFFQILIVLFDLYGRVNIWRNWNSLIIEKKKRIASGRCVFDFSKILIISTCEKQ